MGRSPRGGKSRPPHAHLPRSSEHQAHWRKPLPSRGRFSPFLRPTPSLPTLPLEEQLARQDQTTISLDVAHKGEPPVDADDQDKANYAYARWRIQDDAVSGPYKEWTQALLFLLKKQWYRWDNRAGRWSPEKNVPRWRQRPVTNLTYAVYRTAIAKLTKSRPTFDVVPPSGDTDDRQSAKLAEAILQQKWRELGLPKTHYRAAGWLLATGNAFLRIHWDPEAGASKPLTVPIQHPLTGEQIDIPADENGDPKTKQDPESGEEVPDLDAEPHTVAEGEVQVSLVSPFSVRFNPDAESPEDATECFLGDLWPIDKAAEHFEIAREDLVAAQDDRLTDAIDLITAAASSSGGPDLGMGANVTEVVGPRVLVLQHFRKPCKDYPKGRHWIQCNRKMVSPEEELPYGFWPPVVAIQDTPVPGQPMAIGLLAQIVPLNDEYNKITGKIREHQVMMGYGGKWIVRPEDRRLEINTDPAQILVTKAPVGLEPKQIAGVPLTPDVYAERETIKNDAMFVSGTTELTASSDAPGSLPSGRSLLVQQEISNSVLEPTLLALENAWSEAGRRILVLVKQYYREERAIKARGQSGEWEFRAFSGADLTDSMDVQVQAGSMFPWAKSAKFDVAMQMLEKMPGLYTDPQTGVVDTMKMAKYLDVGGMQAFQSDGDDDQLEINREHNAFAAFEDGGDPVTIDPEQLLGFWQDHAKHAAGHRALLKRDRGMFDKWHPLAQKNFLLHVQLTDQALQGVVQSLQPQVTPGAPAEGDQGQPSDNGGPPGQQSEGPPQDMQLTPADFGDAGQ